MVSLSKKRKVLLITISSLLLSTSRPTRITIKRTHKNHSKTFLFIQVDHKKNRSHSTSILWHGLDLSSSFHGCNAKPTILDEEFSLDGNLGEVLIPEKSEVERMNVSHGKVSTSDRRLIVSTLESILTSYQFAKP